MKLDNNEIVSALVVLRPASGITIDADTEITSENINDFKPSLDDVVKISNVLTEMGFVVEDLVGISFAISAPASTFEKVLNTRLVKLEDGSINVMGEEGALSYEIPIKSLPESIAELVHSLTFVSPPDFGPTDFYDTFE
jgi:subtilase family serine protease